jgi:hypothetical protein
VIQNLIGFFGRQHGTFASDKSIRSRSETYLPTAVVRDAVESSSACDASGRITNDGTLVIGRLPRIHKNP